MKHFFPLIVLVLLLFTAHQAYSQISKVDSLKAELAQDHPDTTRLKVLRRLQMAYLNRDNEQSYHFAQQAVELSETIGETALKIDPYYGLGLVYEHLGEFDSGLLSYQKALDFAEEVQDTMKILNVYTGFGRINKRMYNHEEALKYYMTVLELAPPDAYKLRAITLNNIGGVHEDLNQNEEAIPFYEQALELHLETGIDRNIGGSMMGLGVVHMNLGHLDKTKELFDRAVPYIERSGNKILLSIQYEHYGNLNRDLGDYQEALVNYQKSMDLAVEMNDQYGIASVNLHLGLIHHILGDCGKAVPELKASVEVGEKAGFTKYIDKAYQTLADCAAQNGDYQQAYVYYQQYAAVRDSLFDVQRTQQIHELEARYQSQQKEIEIASLQEQQSLTTRLSQTLQWALIASFVIGLMGVGFFFYRARANRKLLVAEREVDHMKTQFFANISHEFRTPLTLILGPLQKMYRGNFEGDPKTVYGVMIRNAQRLLTLINQLLDLSKLEEGKLNLHATENDLVHFVRLLTSNYTSLAEGKNINYTFFTNEDSLEAWYDPDKLEKVVQNLISNALKFTPEGGEVSVYLGKKNEKGKDYAEIVVKDSGVGIPEEELDKVFDRFYQASSNASRDYEGTGIGLSLTKELTELHRGSISVKSKPGKGSTFRVLLPLGDQHLRTEERTELEPGQEEPATTTLSAFEIPDEHLVTNGTNARPNSPTVLIVEDNQDMREFIMQALANDYQVLEAKDGEEGLAKADEEGPALIISDVMMPRMNGLELCEKLKTNAETSHIPVVLLTAKADRSSKIQGLDIGADDYLAKPFDEEELKLIIRNRIRQRENLRGQFQSSEGQIQLKELGMTSADEKFLQKAIEIVEEHIGDTEFQVEQLCREIGFSQRHLHRKLTALTDLGPNQFIRHIRLKRAADMIRNKTDKISQIALEVGFNNMSYFNKCFKEQYGVTPGEYAVQPGATA